MTRVKQAGARIEELLGVLRSASGEAGAAAEELVRLLLGLYGDGLGRIMAALAEQGPAGAALQAELLDDPVVEGLLLLHDLHPLDADTRIQRALDRVRPYLGSHAGGVEYLGIDADGVARLRLAGNCHGCPSSTVTVQLAIQGAVEDAAPEVTEVAVEGVTAPPEPALLQIGRRPDGPAGTPPGSVAQAGSAAGDPGQPGMADAGWVTLPSLGPPDGRPAITLAAGVPIVVCSVRGTLYAYYDACAACGSSFADGTVTGERLGCPGCGAGYDLRAAGRGLDDPARHLNPLPLLTDSHGVRVAMPAASTVPATSAPAGEAVSR
jgi:Fe-S cluster biogenesis protein NfuA/nitrite reductase/ring-hydroxylating ferredoxin subunit